MKNIISLLVAVCLLIWGYSHFNKEKPIIKPEKKIEQPEKKVVQKKRVKPVADRVKIKKITYTHAYIKSDNEYIFYNGNRSVFKCRLGHRVRIVESSRIKKSIKSSKNLQMYRQRSLVLYGGLDGFYYKDKELAIKSFISFTNNKNRLALSAK